MQLHSIARPISPTEPTNLQGFGLKKDSWQYQNFQHIQDLNRQLLKLKKAHSSLKQQVSSSFACLEAMLSLGASSYVDVCGPSNAPTYYFSRCSTGGSSCT